MSKYKHNAGKNKIAVLTATAGSKNPHKQVVFSKTAWAGWKYLAVSLLICLLTVIVYSRLAEYDFIAFDDDQYVYENPHIKNGITSSSIWWALTAFHFANWHPVSWLSHMIDYQLFGLNAGSHHIVNLVFHLFSIIILYIILIKTTHMPWRSMVVTAVFAIHPLHVESVAWIAERKDVLSTFLGLLAILFYTRFTKSPSIIRYLMVFIFFTFSLLAKSMMVTIPCVLLLLDIWPLKRLQWPLRSQIIIRLLIEKLPLFVLVIPASIFTFVAAERFGEVASVKSISVLIRFENASLSYIKYIGKAIWPSRLAVLYPFQTPYFISSLIAAFILVIISVLTIKNVKKYPFLLVGWFWYIGMVFPVSGIAQAGSQAMADRFTYLPLVGLSIAAVWGIAEIIKGRQLLTRAVSILTIIWLIFISVTAYRQVSLWKNSKTLFEHAIAVTENNYIINNNLGVVLANAGKYSEAIECYNKAISYNQNYAEAHANLGHELLRSGNMTDAYSHLQKAVLLKPGLAAVHADLGTILAANGNYNEARTHLEETLRLSPDNSEMQSNLAYVLQRLGRYRDAIVWCNKAIMLQPSNITARYNLATAFIGVGLIDSALVELNKILKMRPNDPSATAALRDIEMQNKLK